MEKLNSTVNKTMKKHAENMKNKAPFNTNQFQIKDGVLKTQYSNFESGIIHQKGTQSVVKKDSHFFEQKKINSSKRKENMSELMHITAPMSKSDK